MRPRLRILIILGLLLTAAGWCGQWWGADTLRAAERSYLRGDFERAAALYGQAVPETADPGHAVFNRGASLLQEGRFSAAAADFRAALDAGDPDRTARAAYDLGNAELLQALQPREEDPAGLLHNAIDHYQTCLDQSGPAADSLRDSANHNQALARKLLDQFAPREGQSGKEEKCPY
jgi:tetratricopeptide (TPR) repeat protein